MYSNCFVFKNNYGATQIAPGKPKNIKGKKERTISALFDSTLFVCLPFSVSVVLQLPSLLTLNQHLYITCLLLFVFFLFALLYLHFFLVIEYVWGGFFGFCNQLTHLAQKFKK